jgi:hypothetical protein
MTYLKTREEIQTDAMTLHGMLQGLEILQGEVADGSPRHNAIYSMINISVQLADALCNDLDSSTDNPRAALNEAFDQFTPEARIQAALMVIGLGNRT